MFDGQAGLAECQKSRPGWDSDPQSLNGLIWHKSSPMRYQKDLLCHSTVRVSCPTTRRQTETTVREAPLGFVPRTSCLQDRRTSCLQGSQINRLLTLCTHHLRSNLGTKSHVLKHRPKARLGFEPWISDLQDRHFNKLSHGANLLD